MFMVLGFMGVFLLPPVMGPISRTSESQNSPPPGNPSVSWPAAGVVRESVRLADWPSQRAPKSSCAGEYAGPLLIGAGATPGFIFGGVGDGEGEGCGAMPTGAPTLLGAEVCAIAASKLQASSAIMKQGIVFISILLLPGFGRQPVF